MGKPTEDSPSFTAEAAVLSAKRERREHPKGFATGITWDKGKGHIASGPLDAPPEDWSALGEQLGLPDFLEVDPNARMAMTHGSGFQLGREVVWYKIGLRLKHGAQEPEYDYTDLLKQVRRRKGHKPPATASQSPPQALVVNLADWQLGKADGDGTAGVVGRVLELKVDVVDLVREYRRAGANITQLVVLGLGDILEGCDGHYATQTFSVELDRRAQLRMAYELVVSLIDGWVDLAPEMLVACVAGNHGENRKEGKAYTTPADNDDVSAFEIAKKVCSQNQERYGHIKWLVPDGELSISFEVQGTIIGIMHGHKAGGGGVNPHQKIIEWFKGQALGRRPVSDADVLINGHYHHFVAKQDSGRWFLQCPALDGGSEYYEEAKGTTSTPGVLTFVTGGGTPVDRIRIL